MFRQHSKRLFELIGMAAIAVLMLLGLMSLAGFSSPTASARQTTNNNVPPYLSYTGFARDGDGVPLNGEFTLTLRIYDNIGDGNSIWSNQYHNVAIEHGYYNVSFSADSVTNSTLFDDPDTFIGVTIEGYGEMLPRQRFASVPYAVHSLQAVSAETATTAQTAISAETAQTAAIANGLNPNISLNTDELLIDGQKPIIFRRYVNITSVVTDISADDYICGIVGFETTAGNMQESGTQSHLIYAVTERHSTGNWQVRADFISHSTHEFWHVNLMCVDTDMAEGW